MFKIFHLIRVCSNFRRNRYFRTLELLNLTFFLMSFRFLFFFEMLASVNYGYWGILVGFLTVFESKKRGFEVFYEMLGVNDIHV